MLYQSEMDASGNFHGAQGRFKRGEPGTIYIDINAGLNGKHDVGNLAKYTMLRTFAHEFTHFIEKWNPVQYNEFRKVVFDTLRERGENVDDLVEAKQAAGLSYDMASREVVAEAMTDILPDSHFVQNLAEKHKSIFQKLMEKLKEFVEDLRSYFDSLGKNRSREANALKEQVGKTVRYVENIVKMFDQVAEQAVENYQLTGEVIEKPGVVQYQSSHLSEKSLQEWHRNYKNQEDSFSKDIDVWNREGRPPKATFLLGSTGDVLQGLGAIESDIYMLGDKISIILEKHKEMTLNEIKRIPEILNDPVMILKSRNVGRGDKSNTRIVVFGSLKAQNGQPVLAVMDLRPVEKGFRIDNMQKIDSAYTKTASRTKSMAENGRAFVKSSDVLYLDKKRTTRLLSAIGFYMPITCNRSGYIGSISYNGENVNIRGAKFSDVISESFDLEQEQRRDYIDEGYATDSTNWAYENFIIDETDRARFYEVIADLNKRNYSVPRNKNGVYMIEHNNKIMFTDGDFKAPTLSKVIVFDTNYDANMAYAKGLIFDEERRTAGHGEAVELLNRMYGDGFIHEYNVRNYQRNDWQDGRGEGSNRRSAGKAGSGRRIFKGQYQERTSPLTDRDVLEAAANDVGISDMSDAEQAALQTFQDRLTELHELQEERAEAGRLYKEQQFGANADRQAASQTLERMYELDKQIAAASRKVLGAENSKVLKPILQYVRKSVEKKERERSKAVLERWRDRRDNAEAMTDILPDSHFVQNLAEKHKSIFQKLMEKLKEFVEGLRSYFDSLGKNRSREANALKEQVGETVRYVENIVKMFDQVAEQAVENYQLTAAAEQTAEFSQEQNRGNSERGERYDLGRNDGDLQTISSGLDGRTNSGKSADDLGQVLSPKEWSALDGEKQQQIINQLDAYTYSSEEAEIVLSLSAKGDISDEDIRREAVTEMARQFYEAMQGDRVLLENDGRFRWLGDMVGLLIEDVQAIQDGTFVADEFWEQEQRRKYQNPNEPKGAREWSVFNRSLANKTSSLTPGQTKRIVISTANHIYLVEATGYMSYGKIEKYKIAGNEKYLRKLRKEYESGAYTGTETFSQMAQDYGVQRGRNDWDNVGDGYAKEARPADVLDGGESEGDTAGYLDDYYGFGSGEELSEAIRGGALVLDDDGNLIQLLDDEVQEQRRDYIDEGYATDSTNWAYENFIIDETDRVRFYEVIADLNKRNYSVPRNKNGVYMIEHENKIMFTDGDFKAPTLSKVIVFDTNYDANMAYAKGLIFDEERRTAGHGEALRAIEDLFGEGYVSEYNSKIYKPDAWKNRGREREDGRGIDQEVQDQERTSPLTDRDVLEAAANDIGISDMSDAEQAALQTFKDRLTELHELQDKRAEAGRLYKEQQFGANVDRQAASVVNYLWEQEQRRDYQKYSYKWFVAKP